MFVEPVINITVRRNLSSPIFKLVFTGRLRRKTWVTFHRVAIRIVNAELTEVCVFKMRKNTVIHSYWRWCYFDCVAKLRNSASVCCICAAIQLVIWPDIIRSIYALYERNKMLALSLLVYILAQAGASLWFSFIPSVTRSPFLLFRNDPHEADIL